MNKLLLGLAAMALAAPTAAAEINVWSTSFDTGYFESVGPLPFGSLGVTFGGGGTESAGTLPGAGTQFFRNKTAGVTTFDAFGLGAHTALRLKFDLVFVDSWDSDNGIGGVSPDYLFVNVDGTPYQFTTWSASGSNEIYGPGVFVGRGNYVGSSYLDTIVSYDLLIPHVASNFAVTFAAGGAGFQYGDDESWGLDNWSLSAITAQGGIPEPATWAMLIAGFGLVGAAARRRRETAVSA